MIELNLTAGDGPPVYVMSALRLGRRIYIGRDLATREPTAEPTTIRLDRQKDRGDLQFYRKYAAKGVIEPADKATAAILKVPFSAPKKGGKLWH